MILSSLRNLCVLCVSAVKGSSNLKPQRRRERRGCTEKTRSEIPIGLVLLLCLTASFTEAQNSKGLREGELLEPYVLREDFQGESLGQFASYPPAQDIGYEPSLSPTSDFGAPGGRALMRIVKPNRAGTQRFGFIKKVRLALAADSRLRFSYRINSPKPATIEIGFAGTNGDLYTTNLAAKTNQWSIADVSINELRAPAGSSIEAIYIVTNLNDVDPDFTYRFIIDDVAVSALREAQLRRATDRVD